MCYIPISEAANKANEWSTVEAFCVLPRLHFEMLSIDSILWFIELDGELNCLDLLKTFDLKLRPVKAIAASWK